MDATQVGAQIRNAIKRGDTAVAIGLIEGDRSLLAMMTPFGTWLHVAASFGNLELVKYLVGAGAEVNRRGGTYNGNALLMAADNGHVEVVQYLRSCGSELDVSEPERNPLFAAIHSRHNAVVELLIQLGIDTKKAYTGKRMKGVDALAFAQEHANAEAVEMLRSR